MNRFLRTAYSTTLVYLVLALIASLATGAGMPFLSFLCLYFGLLVGLLPCAAPKLRGKEGLLGALGVLLALAGFVPIRLCGGTLIHCIAHGLGLLAAGLFVRTLRHRTIHDDFAAKFRFSAVLLLAAIAYMYLSLLVGITDESLFSIRKEHLRQALDHLVPTAIMLLMTGVLLLRGLRGLQGMTDERAFNRQQLRDLLLYGAIVSTVFLVNPFPYLYRGMAWAIGRAARFFVWAFDRLLELLANKDPQFDPPSPEVTPEPSDDIPPPPAEMVTAQEPAQYKIDEAGESTLYNLILYIFLAATAIALLVILIVEVRKLIRRLRLKSGSRSRGYPEEIRESLDRDDSAKKGQRPKRHSAAPRLRMRYLYGEFLRFLRRVPIRIRPADTCGEINDHAHKVIHVSDRDLAEFRQLYEQARYCDDRTPTEQDAARMKRLLDRLKKGNK